MLAFCPACKGGVSDPLTEYVEFCSAHRPDVRGLDDGAVVYTSAIGPSCVGEAESATNRAMCALLHRDRAEPADVVT